MNGLPQNVLLNFRLEFPKSDLTIYLPFWISEISYQMVSTPEPLVSLPRDQETTGSGDENGLLLREKQARQLSTCLSKPLTAQRCSHRWPWNHGTMEPLNHWTIEPLNEKSQIAQEYGLLPADARQQWNVSMSKLPFVNHNIPHPLVCSCWSMGACILGRWKYKLKFKWF